MSKIIKIILNTLLILIISVLLIYLLLRMVNKVEIFSVLTGSMEENIHAGDYVLVYKINDYKIGDVITYEQNNNYITHRIIKKEDNVFTTKGDANNMEDTKINDESIIGKVILSGGILNVVIKYKWALVTALVAFYLISSWIDKRKQKKEVFL